MPNNRLNAALCRLTRSMLRESREGFTLYTVMSSTDEEIYVLADRDEALEIAADMDSSCFELSAKEI